MMARPISEQREQPKTATIHDADTMMTNDTLPYEMVSTDPGIDMTQQYDLVVSRHHSESGIQRVVKVIFYIIIRKV